MYRQKISKKTSPLVNSTPISNAVPTSSYGSLSSVVQRAQQDVNSISGDERQQLESAIGTKATGEMLMGKQSVPEFKGVSSQLWGTVPLQAKLTIGGVGDKYEREADRVSASVVEQINRPAPVSTVQSGVVQEKEEGLRMKPMLQRREAIAGGEASTDLESDINSARSSGQPLDAGLQQSMGQAMGADFSGVRVHTGERADRLNQSLSARAFTTGRDLFFKKGEYQPGSRQGQGLIAHELTHVMQQKPRIIQFHLMRPKTLVPKKIKEEDKKPWKVNKIFTKEDKVKLKDALRLLVGRNKKVDALKFHDATPQEMNDDPEDKLDYSTMPARVTPKEGKILINNKHDAHYNTDGTPNKKEIRSTVVHESMHAVSANHTGLQDFGKVIEDNILHSPDEALTDYFAIQIYQQIFGDSEDYDTGYWVPVATNANYGPIDKYKGNEIKFSYLPAVWTGDMVGILKDELGLDDNDLKEAYFKEPQKLGNLIIEKKAEIQERWKKLQSDETFTKHKVMDKEKKEILLTEVIEENKGKFETEDDLLEKLKEKTGYEIDDLKRIYLTYERRKGYKVNVSAQ